MRYRFLRFPEGKLKALTFSYDDGVIADARLAELLEKHGLKGTFNINSNTFDSPNEKKLGVNDIKEKIIAKGHEVAIHGKRHIAPGNASPAIAIKDILDCRIDMEREFDTIIRGMAYPDTGINLISNQNSYDCIKSYLKDLDIAYARTLGGDNDTFSLPADFHAWMPTAHHRNAHLLEWAEKFVNINEKDVYLTRNAPRLFYLWGHTYEFDRDSNWDVIENFCEIVSGKDDIWYATNIEIYDYVMAYNSLVFSALGDKVYNPTLIDIWMFVDGTTYKIPSGASIKL